MRRFERKCGVPLVVLLALGASGCLEERSFYISQSQKVTSDDECVVDTEESAEAVSAGTLDISEGLGYYMNPLVHNDLIATKGIDGQPERNNLYVNGFRVKVDLGGGDAGISSDLLEFETQASGLIRPGGKAVYAGVEVFPAELSAELGLPAGGSGTVIVSVQALADHNQSRLESLEFDFPIHVCNGCLVRDIGTCPETQAELDALPVNVCGTTQDQNVVCCSIVGGGRTCNPRSLTGS